MLFFNYFLKRFTDFVFCWWVLSYSRRFSAYGTFLIVWLGWFEAGWRLPTDAVSLFLKHVVRIRLFSSVLMEKSRKACLKIFGSLISFVNTFSNKLEQCLYLGLVDAGYYYKNIIGDFLNNFIISGFGRIRCFDRENSL